MHKNIFIRNKSNLFVQEEPRNLEGRKKKEERVLKRRKKKKDKEIKAKVEIYNFEDKLSSFHSEPSPFAKTERQNSWTQPTWKAVGYKGRLGCIEILKAKAAIAFDRFHTNKVQWGAESHRTRGGGGRGGGGGSVRSKNTRAVKQIIALTRGGARRDWQSLSSVR